MLPLKEGERRQRAKVLAEDPDEVLAVPGLQHEPFDGASVGDGAFERPPGLLLSGRFDLTEVFLRAGRALNAADLRAHGRYSRKERL